MQFYKVCFLIMLGFLFACSATAPNEDPDEETWRQLFNGQDLDDWTVKIKGYEVGENFGNTFSVKDGKMVVSYDAYDEFNRRYGHIFYNEPFGYYKLRAEYRFVGEQANGGEGWAFRNSGLMLHGQDASTMGVDQDFPISIEVQLLGGAEEGERSTCNLCTPGTNVVMDGELFTSHCINSSSKTFRGDQWVTAEVLVLGDSLMRHFVNGDAVLEYTKPQIGGGNVSGNDPALMQNGKLLPGGSISLQSESHPVEFRKVELLELEGCMDPDAKNFKSYFVKANNSLCEY